VFDDAVQLTFGDIPETIHELEPDESSWIVIVTRSHHLDKDALKEGVARERLEQVHAPIGLDLGAETPDEIALTIAAEMLMIRKKGSGASLHTLHRLLEDGVAKANPFSALMLLEGSIRAEKGFTNDVPTCSLLTRS
jgi:xanthine dehydrogenase accessory factor